MRRLLCRITLGTISCVLVWLPPDLSAQASVSQQTPVYTPVAVDEPPARISCPPASISRELTDAFDAAQVNLRFIVGADGRVEPASIEVVSSSDEGFAEPARRMLSGCRYRPGIVDGSAVRVLITDVVRWTFRRPQSVPALPDSIDLMKIYSRADSVNGRPLITQWPQLITCPRYDPQQRANRRRVGERYDRPRDFERVPVNIDAVLEIVVGPEGIVQGKDTKVVRTTDRTYNRELEQWVQSCRFQPGQIGDTKVRIRLEFPVKFEFVR